MMDRHLERELLDDLPADDPRAVASRKDLCRLNRLMGNAGIIASACRKNVGVVRRVVELGAGDGTLLLNLPALFPRPKEGIELKLVDQQKIVRPEVLEEYRRQGWMAENIRADIFQWLEQEEPPVDLMVANLFLHHFTEPQLHWIFQRVARRTNMFVACEPRRDYFPLAMTRLLWLIGCNEVTQHDAAISVWAGFTGNELTQLWPDSNVWRGDEYSARLFSHCFVVQRRPAVPRP
jgi:hypothetical protein